MPAAATVFVAAEVAFAHFCNFRNPTNVPTGDVCAGTDTRLLRPLFKATVATEGTLQRRVSIAAEVRSCDGRINVLNATRLAAMASNDDVKGRPCMRSREGMRSSLFYPFTVVIGRSMDSDLARESLAWPR